MVVYSSFLPSTVSTQGHNVYTPSDSTSAQEMSGSTFNVGYGGGGNASGPVYTVAIRSICI